MSERRENPVTGRHVICAATRGARPHDAGRTRPRRLPAHAETCPFCPGNEDQLEVILAERPGKGGWLTRVVPNRYPIVAPTRRIGAQLMPAAGRHEVVIESPRHDLSPAAMTAEELLAMVETYRERYRALAADPDIRRVFIFRNHGADGGTSLIHPHSQIVGTAFVPPAAAAEDDRARRHLEVEGDCLLCRVVADELRGGSRIVSMNDAFLAFVPYAAEAPFELWIAPRAHRPDFGAIGAAEMAAFAAILGNCLARIADCLGDPPYNYALLASATGRPHLHWYLRVSVRSTITGGFEMATGVAVNPSRPEADAAFLRGE